jgi:organic anion transporter 5A
MNGGAGGCCGSDVEPSVYIKCGEFLDLAAVNFAGRFLLLGWLDDWLVVWLAGWLYDWLAGWLAGWFDGWMLGWLVG